MTLEKLSPCKVNLLLNILGRRPDGFHELETIIQPVKVYDRLAFSRESHGIQLTCSHSLLPTDSQNLAYRAAAMFLERARITDGVRIHLVKNIPLAAGLGGGSGNAATTLLGLNELFGGPLGAHQLQELAASLGSDVPFFLQSKPALAIGRGEQVQALGPLRALSQSWLLLIHPGFGISTAWAYGQLPRFPDALNGKPGRARLLLSLLQGADLSAVGAALYNALEAPALEKFPLLRLFQEFLRGNGATGALMSGSGSTTFALVQDQRTAEQLLEKFKSHFGTANWLALVPAA
jgi:4-diphosphocytidyl-2-C-methyl-D-erythritol kinase